MLAEIFGPELLIVLAVILVLFGGSQLPKLARGLGSAQREFKKGLDEGAADEDARERNKPTERRRPMQRRVSFPVGRRRIARFAPAPNSRGISVR